MASSSHADIIRGLKGKRTLLSGLERQSQPTGAAGLAEDLLTGTKSLEPTPLGPVIEMLWLAAPVMPKKSCRLSLLGFAVTAAAFCSWPTWIWNASKCCGSGKFRAKLLFDGGEEGVHVEVEGTEAHVFSLVN